MPDYLRFAGTMHKPATYILTPRPTGLRQP